MNPARFHEKKRSAAKPCCAHHDGLLLKLRYGPIKSLIEKKNKLPERQNVPKKTRKNNKSKTFYYLNGSVQLISQEEIIKSKNFYYIPKHSLY